VVKKTGFELFSEVFCISLKRNADRRQHMKAEFARHEIEFNFVNAYDWDGVEVNDLIKSEFVIKYPPCFRCGQLNCACENKSLFPPQIGNWLSHMKVWGLIADSNDPLTLVCEDDIVFIDSCQKTLEMLNSDVNLQKAIDSKEPLLLRLGWALCGDHDYAGVPYLNSEIRMSNPCYAISPSMATLLLSSLNQIDTTSDIYLHRIIGSKGLSFTVFPPLVHDLSWSTGEFPSEIRPKEKYVATLRQELEYTNFKDPRYAELVKEIKHEEDRVSRYAEFNKHPVLDHWKP